MGSCCWAYAAVATMVDNAAARNRRVMIMLCFPTIALSAVGLLQQYPAGSTLRGVKPGRPQRGGIPPQSQVAGVVATGGERRACSATHWASRAAMAKARPAPI